MDANGLRSFGLSYGRGFDGWRVPDAANVTRVTVERDLCHRIPAVRLANRAAPARFVESAAQAADVALLPSIARDRFGNYVVWHAATSTLYSVAAAAEDHPELQPVAVSVPDAAKPVRDLAMGADDVLYVAGANGLWLIDMRARFEPFRIQVAGFEVQRIAADPKQGVWALDVTAGRVARVTGLPPFTTGVDLLRERNDRFEATEAAPQPPKMRVLAAAVGAGERAVALAVVKGRAAILAIGPERARLRVLTDDQQWSAPIVFDGPRFPHSFAFSSDDQFAVIANVTAQTADGTPQPQRDLGAFTYRLDAALLERALTYPGATLDPLAPLGDYHPLTGRASGPLVNAAPGSTPSVYFARRHRWVISPTQTLELAEPAPLARLSLAARASYGLVANFPQGSADQLLRIATGVVDTKDATTEWHRLYVEASVPRGTAMIIWLAANDGPPPQFEIDPAARDSAHERTWFPHVVGDPAVIPEMQVPVTAPRAAWLQAASEVASGLSFLLSEREPGITGLFTVLVQKAGLTVRTLKGQRLWMAVELFGDSRASPELVAVRAYAGRFSYLRKYLPTLYHEQTYGPEADRPGRATGPDFLERFIDLFEGVFTSVEDRIANAHLVTDVAACPPDALPWLGTWIGMALDDLQNDATTRRARTMQLNAPTLARRHGTLDGMRWALDIATDGGVTRGRLVVVENFRLRRTMATILGADLADENDPLTLGITQSGNSLVGDSLFLGDENAKTFLALFRSELADDPAVHALYDGLAHRTTVLVHETLDADELRRVRRLAADVAPAHVAVSVVAARHSFLVAVASLVGADTYLRAAQKPDAVRVGISQVGYVDTLQGLGTLDAPLGTFGPLGTTAATAQPIADPGPDRRVDLGEAFTLDGSASRAAPGRTLEEFWWRLLPDNQ
jgi:phage tail-like protein